MAERWEELPEYARTPAQMLGRKFTGCEATHGVFPACDFGCRPCYHAANANQVRVDGAHTVAEVERQMAYLRDRRGPGQYAQLIGGEVSLLPAEAHAEALEVMRRYQRFPMSFTHGDFDYDYLERVAVRLDGTRRFDVLSFAVHIDSTMYGRRGAVRPSGEAELHEHRRRFREMFARLEREQGVRAHLAHNMTVTPDNVGEVADVVRVCRDLGYRMCSFQPAAHVGDERRWDGDYRTLTDDAVWAEVERGTDTRLPYRALQVGDTRCNRVTWGLWVGDRYTPVLDDTDPRDLRARDAFLRALPGNLLFAPRSLAALRIARAVLAHPGAVPVALAWAGRFARRAGLRALAGAHATTYVMHSFMDARDVAPAWELLQQGITASDPRLRATQERLQACAYGMAHPERDDIVPACVQHSVLDEQENTRLMTLLPARHERLRPPADGPVTAESKAFPHPDGDRSQQQHDRNAARPATSGQAMSQTDVEFFFDPVCPFCWVTSQWLRTVQAQRSLDVDWRFISLRMLNDRPGAYDHKPAGYPAAHQRGLEMLRVAAAARAAHGREVIGDLYQAMGQEVWDAAPPHEPEFEAILDHSAQAGDLPATLERVGLPRALAAAARDPRWDEPVRADTEEALTRTGGDVGTPVVSLAPPDGPAFFGPVISEVPADEEAVELWGAVETLARWPGFAELKRVLRAFPDTPVTAKLAGSDTTVS